MKKTPRVCHPYIYLVYATPQFELPSEKDVTDYIRNFEGNASAESVETNWVVNDGNSFSGLIKIGQHQLRLAGVNVPLPASTIQKTVIPTHWDDTVKQHIRSHRAHLIIYYEGYHPDPVEQMIAIYKAASALKNDALIGVVNEAAWTCHPVTHFLDVATILNYRQELPFALWFGYIKLYTDPDHYWFFTRGHYLFNVPDLAYFCTPNVKAFDIMRLFINIFYYVFEAKHEINIGDTMEVQGGNNILRFAAVQEGADMIESPGGTLVIEKISASNVN